MGYQLFTRVGGGGAGIDHSAFITLCQFFSLIVIMSQRPELVNPGACKAF